MPRETLESVMEHRVKPIIEEAVQHYLGIKVGELEHDISEKLEQNPLLEFNIDTSIRFKEAKILFKKQFLRKLLVLNYGNISEVAKIADIDRRSIHRILNKREVKKIREEMLRPYELKLKAVNKAIEGVLDQWKEKEVLNPEKLKKMYENVNVVSDDIIANLPVRWMTLKQAEEEFEKRYLKKAMEENGNNITLTAKKIGLRYESLHRKIKRLGL